jgi:hypothetical protein
MKTYFTYHFLNYVLNNYKIYQDSDFIKKNFTNLLNQLNDNSISFLLDKDFSTINNFPFYNFYFLRDKRIITNENVSIAYGVNEFRIRETAYEPKNLIPKINNDYAYILNNLKYIYKYINPSFYKIKLLQLFELNYTTPILNDLYFKYLSRAYYTIETDISKNIQKSAVTLIIFEKLLDRLFRNFFIDLESTISQKIDFINKQNNSNLYLTKVDLIENINLIEDTNFSNRLTSLLIKTIFTTINLNQESAYYRIVLDTFNPQHITSEQLQTLYTSAVIPNLNNKNILDDGIPSFINNNLDVEIIDKNNISSIKKISEIRQIFVSEGHTTKIENLFKQFLSTSIDEKYYRFIVYSFREHLHNYLTAHFISTDYNLIPSTYIEPIDEFIIYSFIRTRLIDLNPHVFSQLEYISAQFNTDAIHFFNSHFYTYSEFLKEFKSSLQLPDNLNDSPTASASLLNENIEHIILNLTIDNEITSYNNGKSNRTKFFELLRGISSELRISDECKDIKELINNKLLVEHTCYLQFIGWIDKFINSELFTNYLLTDFIPALINTSKENNISAEHQLVGKIDIIRKYIKLSLIEGFMEGNLFKNETNSIKNIILYCFGYDFGNEFSGLLKNENFENFVITADHEKYLDKTLDSFKSFSPLDIDIYRENIYDFYISSLFSNMLLSVLNQYMI